MNASSSCFRATHQAWVQNPAPSPVWKATASRVHSPLLIAIWLQWGVGRCALCVSGSEISALWNCQQLKWHLLGSQLSESWVVTFLLEMVCSEQFPRWTAFLERGKLLPSFSTWVTWVLVCSHICVCPWRSGGHRCWALDRVTFTPGKRGIFTRIFLKLLYSLVTGLVAMSW